MQIVLSGSLYFVPGGDWAESYPKAVRRDADGKLMGLPVVALCEEPPTDKRKHGDVSAIVLTAEGRLWKVFQSAGRFTQ